MVRLMQAVLIALVVLGWPAMASAHCDALDGPVVAAARKALEARDATPVLKWVKPEHEAEVKTAFNRALAVRAQGGEAQALADTWFFETVVRVHRAGEGAPFEGLKPAGQIAPFVKVIDATISTGSADDLLDKVAAHVRSGVKERFLRAHEARQQADDSVEAGRAFVAAYVEYMHYVENLHKAANGESGPHAAGSDAAASGSRPPAAPTHVH